jgi:hypothetical protein
MQRQLQIFKTPVLRYPRLDTIIMVEEAIRRGKGDLTVRELWKRLPKQVMWQTFLVILDYLEYSGKILVDKQKRVVWIWNPPLFNRVKKEGTEA